MGYDIDKMVREAVSSLVTKDTLDCRGIQPSSIPGMLEHSLLNTDATKSLIEKGCQEARKYRFANVVVAPYYVPMAVELLKGSAIKVCTAVGFPYGAATTAGKVAEIKEALINGAEEIDVAMCYNAIKSGDIEYAVRDLISCVDAARHQATIKAIYEQGIYTEEEKRQALLIIKKSGADFVKISNVTSGKKACVEDVQFVRSIVGNHVGIKIDGGIRSIARCCELLAAGANRLGVSASVALAEEAATIR